MKADQCFGDPSMVSISGYNFPSPLFVTSEHFYFQPLKKRTDTSENLFLCGLDDYVQQRVGKIQYLSFPILEKNPFAQGDPIFSIETEKWLSHYLAPFPLHVVKRNEQLIDNPSLINEDCYGKGWILQIQLSQEVREQLVSLFHEKSLVDWIHKEINAEIESTNLS